jgi:hypothetical protein
MNKLLPLLLPAGIADVQVTAIGERPAPVPPSNTALASKPQTWVPWHLDRIDQRLLPLDGKFTATATGAGVHVFIVSSVGCTA